MAGWASAGSEANVARDTVARGWLAVLARGSSLRWQSFHMASAAARASRDRVRGLARSAAVDTTAGLMSG